jgi:GST-like protein
MIDLYFWPTPNGWKISLMLEECGLPYNVIKTDIGRGDQFKPEFIAISPNNKIPAIVDHEGPDGPIALFESGAILLYLAEKTGKFISNDPVKRWETIQWTFWQMANLGPMAGQFGYFRNYAPEKIEAAIERYGNEYDRLLGVMERQLTDQDYLAGDYSIADMASLPWTRSAERLGVDMDKFPNVQRWLDVIGQRPAATKAYEIGLDWFRNEGKPDAESRKHLFNQSSGSVGDAIDKAADEA